MGPPASPVRPFPTRYDKRCGPDSREKKREEVFRPKGPRKPGAEEERRGSRGCEQVARSQPWIRASSGVQKAVRVETVEDEEGTVEDFFFGQLWLIPSPTSKPRVSPWEGVSIWIRKYLWESRSFQPSDCFPIQRGYTKPEEQQTLGPEAESWWFAGKARFAEVVKEMAGRGRGRGRGGPEGEWGEWGWQPSPFYQPPPYFFPNRPPHPHQQ